MQFTRIRNFPTNPDIRIPPWVQIDDFTRYMNGSIKVWSVVQVSPRQHVLYFEMVESAANVEMVKGFQKQMRDEMTGIKKKN